MISNLRSTATCARAQRGLSLLEVLFAAFLVATVAAFLAPLFVRAVANNIEGGEASTAMSFGKSIQDQTEARPINHPDMDVRLVAPTAVDATVRRALSLVFDTGPHDRSGYLSRTRARRRGVAYSDIG